MKWSYSLYQVCCWCQDTFFQINNPKTKLQIATKSILKYFIEYFKVPVYSGILRSLFSHSGACLD